MNREIFFILIYFFAAAYASAQVTPAPDTLEIGGITVIRDNEEMLPPPKKKSIFKKLNTTISPRGVKTEWAILDIGGSNFVDNTNYAGADAVAYAGTGVNEEWLSINPFKSRNVNIWFVMQQVNLIKHFVHFKYGIGLEFNNYRYKQPIRYIPNTAPLLNHQVIQMDNTPGRVYKKNKLAADYLTVPLMLNFNFTPNRLYPFELSAGISVGYLYASRNKTITSDEGKKKAKDDFDLRPWKLSYIGEATIGFVTLYGSYAFKSMYKRGLDITPYNFGIRIRPVDIFGKIENR